MKHVKHWLITLSVMMTALGAGLLAPAPVFAAAGTPTPAPTTNQAVNDACTAINAGTDCSSPGGVSLQGVITAVVKILSIVVGVAAVIMLIVAGLKFVTAGGDPGAVSSARNMIIYSLVGIVVASMAYALVGYVFHAIQ